MVWEEASWIEGKKVRTFKSCSITRSDVHHECKLRRTQLIIIKQPSEKCVS